VGDWLEAQRTLQARRLALWIPVGFGLGAQAYFLWPSEPSATLALTAAALALAGVLAARRLGRGVALAAALLCLTAGFGAAAVRARLVAAPVLAEQVEALVEGRVRALSQSAAGRPRLLLEAPRIWGLAAAQTPARVRITLTAARHAEGLGPGDLVSVMARLGPPGGPVEPDGFDFARAAWFERLGGVGVARGRVARLADEPLTGFAAARVALDRARLRLSEALRAGIGGQAGAFAAAIVTGDRAALPVTALQDLRDSNLAHLLAISGLHMAIVCGLAFGAARLGLALTPGVGVRWPVKPIAAAAALAAGLAYLALSGAAVATQRAFVMAAVAFLAVIVNRPAVTLRALALAALVVLTLAPESLTQVGFQMSFAATVALVAAYEAAREAGWLAPRPGFWGRAARYGLGLLLTSAIAGLATAPFAAFHFNRLTSFGLIANLTAVPVMGAVVAPALAGAAALAPLGLEAWPLRIAGVGIDWILRVAETVAGWEGAARPIAAAPQFALWLITLGGLWLCLWRGRLRLAGLPALALAAALWLGGAPRPDLLIAPGGAAAGVMTPQGRALDPARPDRFAAETWLRRDGDAATVAEAAARPAFTAEGPWRVAPFGDGWEVRIFRGARLSALALTRQCAPKTVVLAPRIAPRVAAQAQAGAAAGPCLLLDRARLAARGALALSGKGDRLVVEDATAGRAARLWRGAGAVSGAGE